MSHLFKTVWGASSTEELKEIVEVLSQFKKVVITSHINPECDAIGSQLGLMGLLKKMGVESFLVNTEPLPADLQFLPGSDNIRCFEEFFPEEYDAVVSVDCSGEDRIGDVYNKYKDGVFLNIDHHVSNTKFGKINWIDTAASSVCEMVYRLFEVADIPMAKEDAYNIYAGLLNDTGCFRYPNTTPYTHMVAHNLLNIGINGSEIYQNVFEKLTFEQIRVAADTLNTIQQTHHGKIVWMVFSSFGVKDGKPLYDISDEVLNVARQIREAEAFLLFKPAGYGYVRVNLRSRGAVDVNKVAQMFGGGGHMTASGCSIEGDMEDVIDKVITAVKRELEG